MSWWDDIAGAVGGAAQGVADWAAPGVNAIAGAPGWVWSGITNPGEAIEAAQARSYGFNSIEAYRAWQAQQPQGSVPNNPVNNAVNNVVNAIPGAAPVLAVGGGVSMDSGGINPHIGMQAVPRPVTPTPTDAQMNQQINNAASQYNPNTTVSSNGVQMGSFVDGKLQLDAPVWDGTRWVPSNSLGATQIHIADQQPTPPVRVGTSPVMEPNPSRVGMTPIFADGTTAGGFGSLSDAKAGSLRLGQFDDGTPMVQAWSTDGNGTGRWVNVRPATEQDKTQLASGNISPDLAAAGLSAVGGLAAAGGSIAAANTQADANDKWIEFLKEQQKTQQGNIQPWLSAGTDALNKLKTFDTDNPSFGMAQFQQDPGYSFRLDQGIKALERSQAAKGMLNSGNTLAAVTKYGQDLGSQEYQNAYNRFQTERGQRLNNLQSLAGIGQTAVQQSNNASQNYGSQYGNALTGAADARASGYMGAANAGINALGQYFQNQNSTALISALMNRGK